MHKTDTFRVTIKAAYDFLISVAEPVCRPANVHEYLLTPHSLYAAVSVGLETGTILSVLSRLSKTQLSSEIHDFVNQCTANYGKVKLVLQRNRFFLESPEPAILRELLQDEVIRNARVLPDAASGSAVNTTGEFTVTQALRDKAAAAVTLAAIEENFAEEIGDGGGTTQGTTQGGPNQPLQGVTNAGATDKQSVPSTFDATGVPEYDPHREISSFEILPERVEHVKQRCLPGNLGYPTLEEYDFRNDTRNPDLDIALKPMTRIRPYQEKSLSKMFGNGRGTCCTYQIPPPRLTVVQSNYVIHMARKTDTFRLQNSRSSFGNHRATLRRGEIAHGHRRGGSRAQIRPVPVHLLRLRGPVGEPVQAVDEPYRPRDREVHEPNQGRVPAQRPGMRLRHHVQHGQRGGKAQREFA